MQLVTDPHEMVALIEVSVSLLICCKMTRLVSLQPCGTLLNIFLIPPFH